MRRIWDPRSLREDFTNGNGPFGLFANITDESSWNAANSIDTTAMPGAFDIALQNVAIAPRVIIQYLGCESSDVDDCKAATNNGYFSFRIVAIGWADDANAYSVLQAIYLSKQP